METKQKHCNLNTLNTLNTLNKEHENMTTNTQDVKSIKTKLFMENQSADFEGYIGTLKMMVKKTEDRIGKYKNQEKVLSGLAKFIHINGTEYRAKVVFLPYHIVENIEAGELIELPIHRVKSSNSKNGYTFISDEIITDEMWNSF